MKVLKIVLFSGLILSLSGCWETCVRCLKATQVYNRCGELLENLDGSSFRNVGEADSHEPPILTLEECADLIFAYKQCEQKEQCKDCVNLDFVGDSEDRTNATCEEQVDSHISQSSERSTVNTQSGLTHQEERQCLLAAAEYCCTVYECHGL